MTKTSHLDIVSAAWILACNDENPLMTYESVKQRLGLQDNFDLKTLIKLHGELFRQKAPQKVVDEWKEQMLNDQHLPSWIRNIADQEARKARIAQITADDIFRSQFRAKRETPASNISIITWGLEHIDRIRKTIMDEKQERSKMFTSLWIPILSMIISLTAVLMSYLTQKQSMNNQNSLKKIELQYNTKQEGYVNFMKSVTDAARSTERENKVELIKALGDIENSYYNIEFLIKDVHDEEIRKEIDAFSFLCFSNIPPTLSDSLFKDSCNKYKISFATKLKKYLFYQAEYSN